MKYPNINAERVRHGYTFEQMARILGVSRKTLYNWLYHGGIPQSKLKLMSDIFGGCSMDYLAGRTTKGEAHEIDTR